MALDKWQQRQVAQHAADNGVTEAEAEAELFPEGPAAEEGAADPAAAKVSTRKAA